MAQRLSLWALRVAFPKELVQEMPAFEGSVDTTKAAVLQAFSPRVVKLAGAAEAVLQGEVRALLQAMGARGVLSLLGVRFTL